MIEVVLLQDVPRVGTAGARVRVKDGYGLNYLIPKGLGALPRSSEAARVQAKLQHNREVNAQTEREMQNRLQELKGREITLFAKVGIGQKLYGSITIARIAQELGIDKKYIHLIQPIKTIGTHAVEVRFAENHSAKVSVRVAPLATKQ